MEKSIEKLHKLHGSVQKLESVLQEVWSLVEEIEEDVKFKELLNNAKKYHSSKQKPDKSLEELITLLDDFENSMNEIPEDGTAAVDFEDAIAELIEWMRNNQ
jgi:DNA repair ATPase RecN